MSRATVKKILGNPRPLDKFQMLVSLPTEYTYCERTRRFRDVKTKKFVTDPRSKQCLSHKEKSTRRVGDPPILKSKASSGTTGSSAKRGRQERVVSRLNKVQVAYEAKNVRRN